MCKSGAQHLVDMRVSSFNDVVLNRWGAQEAKEWGTIMLIIDHKVCPDDDDNLELLNRQRRRSRWEQEERDQFPMSSTAHSAFGVISFSPLGGTEINNPETDTVIVELITIRLWLISTVSCGLIELIGTRAIRGAARQCRCLSISLPCSALQGVILVVN